MLDPRPRIEPDAEEGDRSFAGVPWSAAVKESELGTWLMERSDAVGLRVSTEPARAIP